MGKRILVVEDDDKSRKLLTDVLGFHGFDVAAFSSGEPAIDDARASPPEAALLDIQLPGLNGFQILELLRAEPAPTRLPVLAVTASVMDHDRRKILDAGFDAYVAKPVNIRELLDTLNSFLTKDAP